MTSGCAQQSVCLDDLVYLFQLLSLVDLHPELTPLAISVVQSIHEGFHQLPKAYGSSVRPTAKVTDFKSGLREGMKVIFSPLSSLLWCGTHF